MLATIMMTYAHSLLFLILAIVVAVCDAPSRPSLRRVAACVVRSRVRGVYARCYARAPFALVRVFVVAQSVSRTLIALGLFFLFPSVQAPAFLGELYFNFEKKII